MTCRLSLGIHYTVHIFAHKEVYYCFYLRWEATVSTEETFNQIFIFQDVWVERKIKKETKKIAKRDAGFFIGRGVKKLLGICKKNA